MGSGERSSMRAVMVSLREAATSAVPTGLVGVSCSRVSADASFWRADKMAWASAKAGVTAAAGKGLTLCCPDVTTAAGVLVPELGKLDPGVAVEEEEDGDEGGWEVPAWADVLGDCVVGRPWVAVAVPAPADTAWTGGTDVPEGVVGCGAGASEAVTIGVP